MPNPGDPQSLNRYSYTLNNPVRFTDPSGHRPEEDSGVDEVDPEKELAIIVCGMGSGDDEKPAYVDAGPDCDWQMPAWMDGDPDWVPYPGEAAGGKSAHADDIQDVLDERGTPLDEPISLICYSAGADTCLMFAQSRIEDGGLIGNLVLLGPTFTGSLPGGGSLGDCSPTTGNCEWEDILDNVLASGTNVYLLDDSAAGPPGATSYRPPKISDGTYTFVNDPDRNHYGHPEQPNGDPITNGDSVNNSSKFAISIFSWLWGN